MVSVDRPPKEVIWQEDPFSFIKPEELESLGVDTTDIPPGTFAARKHPSQIPSRFGGNAYGFGLFEIYDRLDPQEVTFLNSISFENPTDIGKHYKQINQVYKKIGLLMRFSSLGRPYYLIPVHLISNTLTHIKSKVDEITKIVGFHRGKYFKEYYDIGIVTHPDDLIVEELTLRFKEHRFVVLDSLKELRDQTQTLDLVILTRDLYEIILMENISPLSREIPSKKRLEQYAIYLLWKVYSLLKPDGEIFIIANRYPAKTDRQVTISFKTAQEKKNFLLFTHIFKTKKRYQIKGRSIQVNVFDLQKYLSGFYVEQEVMERLSGNHALEDMTLKEINTLPYLNFSLDEAVAHDQEKTWSKLLPFYFDQIFLKPLIPDPVKTGWVKRFSAGNYSPDYMLIYLGQKKSSETSLPELKKDVSESRLSGCPLPFLADYRDSFDYLIRTLTVLNKVKRGSYSGLPEVFMERLRQPLENKKRRYSHLNDVLRLMSKVNRLERIQSYLNPDMIEGTDTKVLQNLEILPFFGFSYGELREIFLIIVGHTAIGRILSGKMNEKALKPISDLARSFPPQQALNLLRYCRLMSMAEMVASKRTDLNQEELAELFDLYESMVGIVTSRDMDWDRLLDEEISSMGGIHNKIIRKILKMMNSFEFLHSWSELTRKGEMEKESLADYDEKKLAKIENTIGLVRIMDQFEEKFLKDEPLQLPTFYRKFLNIEFHGTGHIFERMNSQLAFILLWVAVNVTRGDVINFNPILADMELSEIDSQLQKVEEETSSINTDYLDLLTLTQFSDQLYKNNSAYIAGTGFQLKLDPETQAVHLTFTDMAEDIRKLETLAKKIVDHTISETPVQELEELETLFSNLESFYQGHLRLISQDRSGLTLPARQIGWYEKVQNLRVYLKSYLIGAIFRPENIYSDIDLLYNHSPSLLQFVLPEFMALQDLQLAGRIYLKSPLIDNTLTSMRKIQALIRRDRENFHDVQTLHKLAQREFGPMAAGTVGLNEYQIETLENIMGYLSKNKPLFEALIKSFIFRDLGLIPALREKYQGHFNPADHAQAGAVLLEKEKIHLRYSMNEKAQQYLLSLVKHHDLVHHMIRGEFHLYSIREIIDFKDKDLFDASFISSFIMFSAMAEDLIFEDLATQLFQLRTLCHRIIDGETTLEAYLRGEYADRGRLFYALEEYRVKGLPEKMSPTGYLESWETPESEGERYTQAGSMIYSLERLFRLRGIRYVEFTDLVKFMMKIPLKFIYKEKNYYSIGYATFEKELFEALRIYHILQRLPEDVRHIILQELSTHKIRIFGFENVNAYLNYENLITLLVISLLGSQRFKDGDQPICLDFLGMVENIEKRYEAVNDSLANISIEKIWGNRLLLHRFFNAKTGLLLKGDESNRVLSIDFTDRFVISHKTSHMQTITDVEQLKNYFHYSLRSLRKSSFYTDDYDLELEKAFENRLREITDLMLAQAEKQMQLLDDFQELHTVFNNLMHRSLEIGFTDEQKHRLNDLYELRKDDLKREKLDEIKGLLDTIHEIDELKDYWDGIKWYLFNNRQFIGKEFENLIAHNFDRAMEKLTGPI
jgi:hypothetical protein